MKTMAVTNLLQIVLSLLLSQAFTEAGLIMDNDQMQTLKVIMSKTPSKYS